MIMLGNQITFWSNVRLDQIAFEVVYEKEIVSYVTEEEHYDTHNEYVQDQ